MPFLVEAPSAGKMHTGATQPETPDAFFKKPLSQLHNTTKSCLSPLLPAQQRPEWTHGQGVGLVLENTEIMQPEGEVLPRDFSHEQLK